MPEGQRPRGATQHPRSRAAAGRSYATSEVRGGGQECQAAEHRSSREELPLPEDRGGSWEELPHA